MKTTTTLRTMLASGQMVVAPFILNARHATIAVVRESGGDTGGSNVQFAINPADGRMLVIEMNPRVSRSSALASKATGFPIAKVAAKLAVGYTLDEIDNDITGVTPASFEPTIDYVVTKVPRFTFEKFPGTEALLTTSMKSVGEAMAMGRCFAESLQKALCSLETGLTGLNAPDIPGYEPGGDPSAILVQLARATPDRLLVVADAFRAPTRLAQIHPASRLAPQAGGGSWRGAAAAGSSNVGRSRCWPDRCARTRGCGRPDCVGFGRTPHSWTATCPATTSAKPKRSWWDTRTTTT